MEGHYDRAGDDGEVHGETQPGEEGAFIGTVVAGFGDEIFEDEGTEDGFGEVDVFAICAISADGMDG